MGTTKATPAKAGKSAAEAHHQRGASLVQTPTKTSVTTNSALSSRKRKTRPAEDPENWNFTHTPPTPKERAKNGRHEGRNLVTWTRPRMAEKLLLHIQYECSRHRIDLPWDTIAHRLHPGSSGGAVLQHLNRLRHQLVAEGHLVPPICQKPGSRVVVDQNIRGYVRKFPDSDDSASTRAVTWAEPLDDRKFNIPDAVDQNDPITSTKSEDTGSSARKAKVKQESPDPSNADSGDEYIPGPEKVAKQTPRRPSRAAKAKAVIYLDGDDGDFDKLYTEDDCVKHDDGIADENGDLDAEDYEDITVITPSRISRGHSTAAARHDEYTRSARAFDDDMYLLPLQTGQPAQDDLFGSQPGAAQDREQTGRMPAISQVSHMEFEDCVGSGHGHDFEDHDGIVWPSI